MLVYRGRQIHMFWSCWNLLPVGVAWVHWLRTMTYLIYGGSQNSMRSTSRALAETLCVDGGSCARTDLSQEMQMWATQNSTSYSDILRIVPYTRWCDKRFEIVSNMTQSRIMLHDSGCKNHEPKSPIGCEAHRQNHTARKMVRLAPSVLATIVTGRICTCCSWQKAFARAISKKNTWKSNWSTSSEIESGNQTLWEQRLSRCPCHLDICFQVSLNGKTIFGKDRARKLLDPQRITQKRNIRCTVSQKIGHDGLNIRVSTI